MTKANGQVPTPRGGQFLAFSPKEHPSSVTAAQKGNDGPLTGTGIRKNLGLVKSAFTYSSYTWLHVLSRSTRKEITWEMPLKNQPMALAGPATREKLS